MLYFMNGGSRHSLTDEEIKNGLVSALEQIKRIRALNSVLVLPPDITRFHSRAGDITVMADNYLGDALTDILPAIGTHFPMSSAELDKMYPGISHSKFREHRWRTDLVTLGTVPAEFVKTVSDGIVDYEWPAQVNKLVAEGGHDLILSIGQVVPHEVIGFANQNKNVFVGTGGAEGIHKSHFLGAAYGMEKIMGRADTPVRKVLNYAEENFARNLPIVYVLTVVSPDEKGKLHVRGLFIGEGRECFERAAALSLEVNFIQVDKPFNTAVVYLDPEEFRSTWLGNKSIYRTRMAMADGGQLIIIAPGIREFGEDPEIDSLIRKFGYQGTPATLKAVDENEELRNNLSAAAHLIHGSSEGRFSITYAAGGLSKAEIESAGYKYADYMEILKQYGINGDPAKTPNGYFKDVNNEDFYYINNPALGLWAFTGE